MSFKYKKYSVIITNLFSFLYISVMSNKIILGLFLFEIKSNQIILNYSNLNKKYFFREQNKYILL